MNEVDFCSALHSLWEDSPGAVAGLCSRQNWDHRLLLPGIREGLKDAAFEANTNNS